MEVTLVLHGLLAVQACRQGRMEVPHDSTVADVFRTAGIDGPDELLVVMDGRKVHVTEPVNCGARITAFLRIAGG